MSHLIWIYAVSSASAIIVPLSPHLKLNCFGSWGSKSSILGSPILFYISVWRSSIFFFFFFFFVVVVKLRNRMELYFCGFNTFTSDFREIKVREPHHIGRSSNASASSKYSDQYVSLRSHHVLVFFCMSIYILCILCSGCSRSLLSLILYLIKVFTQ